jgi:hypothetical protein
MKYKYIYFVLNTLKKKNSWAHFLSQALNGWESSQPLNFLH